MPSVWLLPNGRPRVETAAYLDCRSSGDASVASAPQPEFGYPQEDQLGRSGRRASCKMWPMTDTPSHGTVGNATPSPIPRRTKRPSWLDLRLVLGVVLVLAAVATGAFVVSSADNRQPIWAVTHELAAGTVLQGSDLRAVRVQLGAASELYLASSEAVAGKTVQHPLRAGELLPRAELTEPEQGVTVTMPIRPENSPKLGRGDRITVWVTAKTCRGLVVLSGTPVQEVRQAIGASFGTNSAMGVVVSLNSDDAQRVIAALDLDGAVIRVGLLSPGQRADIAATNLGTCATAR